MANDAWHSDPTAKHWFTKIGNERTIKNYKWEFPKFLDFVKVQPKDIVQQRLEQLSTTDQTKRRVWEDKYVEYKHLLENQGLRKNTVKSYLRTVQSFFTNNNVNLVLSRNDTKVRPQNREDLVPTEWIPQNEEIRVLYRMAQNARDRAVLLVLYQSGFSEVDVASMQIDEFPFYDAQGNWKISSTDDLYHQRLRSKTRASSALQQICISREALEEIRIMLQTRSYPKDGYLFVSFRNQPLGVRGINDAMKEIVRHAFNGKAKEWETRHLRDAFMNACEKAKIPQKIADIMAGHKPDGAKSNYAVQQETIETLYKDAFKFLTINGYGSQSRKVEQLTSEVQGLTMQMAALMGMFDSLLTEEQKRRAILEAAKKLPNMTQEKLIHIENNLKMFKTTSELTNALQNIDAVSKAKDEEQD
jgi:site-specific recombinase XerD